MKCWNYWKRWSLSDDTSSPPRVRRKPRTVPRDNWFQVIQFHINIPRHIPIDDPDPLNTSSEDEERARNIPENTWINPQERDTFKQILDDDTYNDQEPKEPITIWVRKASTCDHPQVIPPTPADNTYINIKNTNKLSKVRVLDFGTHPKGLATPKLTLLFKIVAEDGLGNWITIRAIVSPELCD